MMEDYTYTIEYAYKQIERTFPDVSDEAQLARYVADILLCWRNWNALEQHLAIRNVTLGLG